METVIDLPIDYHAVHFSVRKLARLQYIKEQQGACYHCKSLLNYDPPDEIMDQSVNKDLFPPNFFDWPIHLHHNHDTGMTIGAVHCYCNAVLWQHHGE
jgi:hypothetical protein